jgi:hypothetical protein
MVKDTTSKDDVSPKAEGFLASPCASRRSTRLHANAPAKQKLLPEPARHGGKNGGAKRRRTTATAAPTLEEGLASLSLEIFFEVSTPA